jgi:hypothetical protein
MDPTALESGILNWIAGHYGHAPLKSQIDQALVVRREHTGAGFYTHLAIPVDLPPVAKGELPGNPLEGPGIISDQMQDGGGSLLWLKEGFVNFLEVYAFGDEFPEDLREFKLQGRERGE